VARSGLASADIVGIARRLGEEVLFDVAAATDAGPIVPSANLDALAAAGLYGLTGPESAGGLDADLETACRVIEALASACLTTTFVWVQHLGVVLGVAHSDTPGVAAEWLEPLCRGEKRAGIALAGLLAGAPQLRAEPAGDGWVLDGTAPWVTGWGRIDVLQAAARDDEGNTVFALLEARAGPSLEPGEPLDLVAVRASATVRVRFREHVVPAGRVTAIRPAGARGSDVEVLRIHGALALGVAERCCRLLGPSALDGELASARTALDAATDESIAGARAAVSDLALRTAAALVTASGSGSLLRDQHAQRLAREALFLLVFGGRRAVRASLLERLGAARA
jgi:alkylation response protein AidB-like acyl-CoA dehydrogenase